MNCYLHGSDQLNELTRTLRYGEGLVAYCDSCGLGMLDHHPEDLRRYDAEEYCDKHGPHVGERSNYDELFESYVRYQEPRLRHLRPPLAADSRFLEVGCSAGQLLANIKPHVAEVVGIDYDAPRPLAPPSASESRLLG